ncbi:MAG: 23S rRNA (uracil(1939)-C(5))-methyltransferase RlmD [Bacillota bacterium]|nr:23S rRNA (uracil(1939)-C(5))-methyltransferase RlmD [Bacillota bacterium]
MLKVGEKYRIEIVDMGQDGEGIGRAEGMAVFVKEAVIGDICTVEITKVKKNYAFGKLFEIVEPSKDRIAPLCEYFRECGGCSLGALSYEGQLELKQNQVRAALERIGGVREPEVLEIIGMENPEYYRNNGQFPVGGTSENPAVGFYRPKSHYVVDCMDCMLQSEPAVAAAHVLREYIKEYGVSVYNPKTEKGTLRHLIVRNAEGTGEVMVILVINKGKLPDQEVLVEWLKEAIDEIEPDEETGVKYKLRSFVLNINQNKNGGAVMGEKNIFVYGQERITDLFEGIEYLISPRSFYQVNTKQAKKLYATAADFANLTGEETVFDLYCGVGTISLYLASKAKRVIGIEYVKDAVLDANRNAIKNGIVNAVFTCGKAEEVLPEMVMKGTRAHVAVLDPPRSGCDERLLKAVADAGVERIVYVSCNPSTLARDVKILTEMGYEFIKAQPVDMFGWTSHVESVVLLSKVQK